MTPEEATALVKSLIPPGPILIGDSEKFCEVLTDTLVAIVARAVAAERERILVAVYDGVRTVFRERRDEEFISENEVLGTIDDAVATICRGEP